MRNLYSRIPKAHSIYTSPGSRIHAVLEPRFDGVKTIIAKVGEEDIQERIEAFAPYCDINYMLHRLSIGDTSVCSARPALYADFSGMPENPVDAINVIHNAERRFNELSADDKAKYNNDYRRWLVDVITPSAPVLEPVEPVIEPVIKEVSE